MSPFIPLFKYILVGVLGIAGILSLSRGFGMPIPFLEYGALEAWNVLAGAALLASSLCLAFFWRARKYRVLEPQSDAYVGTGDELLAHVTTTGPHLFKQRSR